MNFVLLDVGEVDMALATEADVVATLGRALTTAEAGVVDIRLEEASDLVLAFFGLDAPMSPVPPRVKRITARMVARLFDPAVDASAMPAEVTQMGRTMGPFSQQYTFAEGSTSKSPRLTREDKMVLRGRTQRAFSVDTLAACETVESSSAS